MNRVLIVVYWHNNPIVFSSHCSYTDVSEQDWEWRLANRPWYILIMKLVFALMLLCANVGKKRSAEPNFDLITNQELQAKNGSSSLLQWVWVGLFGWWVWQRFGFHARLACLLNLALSSMWLDVSFLHVSSHKLVLQYVLLRCPKSQKCRVLSRL